MVNKLFDKYGRWVEMLPLPVFLIYTRVVDPAISIDWLGPYLSASVVAILVVTLLLRFQQPINPIFIGINIYFWVGSIGLLCGLGGLNRWLGELQAAGMLLFIAVIGLCLSYVAPRGFVGVRLENTELQRRWSLMLVCIAAACAYFSYQWVGNVWLSEVIPFVGLFSIAGILRGRLLSGERESQPDTNKS